MPNNDNYTWEFDLPQGVYEPARLESTALPPATPPPAPTARGRTRATRRRRGDLITFTRYETPTGRLSSGRRFELPRPPRTPEERRVAYENLHPGPGWELVNGRWTHIEQDQELVAEWPENGDAPHARVIPRRQYHAPTGRTYEMHEPIPGDVAIEHPGLEPEGWEVYADNRTGRYYATPGRGYTFIQTGEFEGNWLRDGSDIDPPTEFNRHARPDESFREFMNREYPAYFYRLDQEAARQRPTNDDPFMLQARVAERLNAQLSLAIDTEALRVFRDSFIRNYSLLAPSQQTIADRGPFDWILDFPAAYVESRSQMAHSLEIILGDGSRTRNEPGTLEAWQRQQTTAPPRSFLGVNWVESNNPPDPISPTVAGRIFPEFDDEVAQPTPRRRRRTGNGTWPKKQGFQAFAERMSELGYNA